MTEKLRMAIIGCGSIADHAHLSNYQNNDEVEIVALCDIDTKRFEYLKEKYAFLANAYTTTDYKDIANDESIDAVDICTPNYLHSIITIEMLNAGKHVLTEKPDAMTVAEVEEMKATAEKNGKVLMAMRNNRFIPATLHLKKMIENGECGEIYNARCAWVRRRGVPQPGSWFAKKAESGGGPLIDLGVHMIDLAMYLMGNPKPVSVTGTVFNKFNNNREYTFDVEDMATGYIKFDNGASLALEFSWESNIMSESRYVELRGTKAGAKIENDELNLYIERYGSMCDEQPHPRGRWGHDGAIRHFVDVIQNGADPIFVPQQGVDMIKILNAIYESAEIGKEVVL
ncbi:MAG: Gfo/Idh/MocA family oxidoreductase [Ruminococcaceae bacterium]|nr:Gfo/Idh/MocA family oxidoreductase [Oscillospiraceae bacterium]